MQLTPKSKINTWIYSKVYKEARKVAIDLELNWSDLLEISINSTVQELNDKLASETPPSKIKEEMLEELKNIRKVKED